MNPELMKRCLAALEESRDDIECSLIDARGGAWEDIIEAQLTEHDAVIELLKKEKL